MCVEDKEFAKQCGKESPQLQVWSWSVELCDESPETHCCVASASKIPAKQQLHLHDESTFSLRMDARALWPQSGSTARSVLPSSWKLTEAKSIQKHKRTKQIIRERASRETHSTVSPDGSLGMLAGVWGAAWEETSAAPLSYRKARHSVRCSGLKVGTRVFLEVYQLKGSGESQSSRVWEVDVRWAQENWVKICPLAPQHFLQESAAVLTFHPHLGGLLFKRLL